MTWRRIFALAGLAWLAALTPALAQCSGVSTKYTTHGNNTFTAPCTGNLYFDAWGAGASASVSGNTEGGGAGAFARGIIVVTSGHTYTAHVGTGGTGNSGAGTAGTVSYICDASVGTCTTALTVCSAAGLDGTNFVCADHGVNTTGRGGLKTASVGNFTTLDGGNGGTRTVNNCGGAGGGAAGPGGANGAGGVGGTYSGSGSCGGATATGGTADGGRVAGGAQASGSGNAGAGTSSDTQGGGGGGGSDTGTAGAGGAPGGGGGSPWTSGNGGNGADGEIWIHDVVAPTQNTVPTLDGVSIIGNVTSPGAVSATLSTTMVSDLVVACTFTAHATGTYSTVSSVADTQGLSWSKRWAGKLDGGSGNGAHDAECWYALAGNATLSSDTITFTYSATPAGSVVSLFAVNGANQAAPWDANVALPNAQTFAGNTTPSGNITTSFKNDMLLAILADGGDSLTESTSAPTGFAVLGYQLCTVCGQIAIANTSVSATQSSVAVAWGAATTGAPLIYTLDAIAGVAPASGLILWSPYTHP